MVADRYPGAAWRPISYVSEAGPFAVQPSGWVCHVAVGNGSLHPYFQGLMSPNRVFSHLWVSKTGAVEQYAPLSGRSWAMAGGNPYWWSVETEGFPSEPLTSAQLDALAAWHVWCGAPDRIATAADAQAAAPGRGVVTHSAGGAAWGNHDCPGSIRAGQLPEILRRAAALRSGGNVALTDAEITAVAVRTRDLVYGAQWGVRADGKPYTLGDMLVETRDAAKRAADVGAIADAIVARLPPGGGGVVDVVAIAKATVDEMSTRLVR